MPYRRAASFALSAASLSVILAACSPQPAEDPRTQIALVRAAVAQPTTHNERSFTGTVVARVQSDLGFRVPGKIVERLVDTGQAVKRGQALMRIDPTDLALATNAREQTVAAAQARVQQTSADETRYRDLVAAGAVSASAYDQIKAAAETALADLNAARAQADVAKNEAGYAVLLADADGAIMDILAEPGQVVTAGQTVVRIARAGSREARIDLPETIRPKLGSAAQASLFGSDREGFPAQLRQLSGAADPLTRTYEARYVLGGSAAQAPLGATVTVSLPGAETQATLEVPLAALYDNGKGVGVWIIDGQPLKVQWRPVQIARLGEETAALSGGLKPGERFVALGAHLLHQDELVRIAATEGASQ